jgi:hypothetical protein
MDDPGILPGRQVRLRSDPAGKEVPVVPVSNVGKPRLDRGSGLLGDLELHRPGRLFLNDGRAVTDPTADADIVDLSMRRTKGAQIYKKTGNLRAVQLLLGTRSWKARCGISVSR